MFLAISFILTGYYINLIVLTSLIVVHEFGHYFMARIFLFNVDGIIIYPYGGITRINDLINKSLNEELIISISGILFQIGYYLIIFFLNRISVIRDYTFDIFTSYNSAIIFFNLLPIYPLDGSKILNLLFCKVFSYKLSNLLTGFVSVFVLLIVFFSDIYTCNYSYVMSLFILLCYIFNYFNNLEYYFNRFLLERHLYDIRYFDTIIVSSINNMYKDKNHLFKIGNGYVLEKKYLGKYFSK